jgi:hypothetical protein
MAERIELPDEQWAELRTPKDLTERLRRSLRHAMAKALRLDVRFKELAAQGVDLTDDAALLMHLTDDEADALYDLQAASIVAYVSEWSFGPVTTETVMDLPASVFDVLAAKTFGFGTGQINPDDPKALLDRNSPPEPSPTSVESEGAKVLPETAARNGSSTKSASTTTDEPLAADLRTTRP